MNDLNRGGANIAAVERETGLGKDTLRVWERRYGFPRPLRDENGDRLYPPEQISQLRLIKRLMDRGHRPGKLVLAEESELLAWSAEVAGAAPAAESADAAEVPPGGLASPSEGLGEVFDLLGRHDAVGLRRVLSQMIAREGLQTFVLDILPRLNVLVGEGWASGQIEVFEEHLYTEQIQVLLRQAIAALPPGTRRPKVLLTTVPDEQHILGVLMLESLLTLRGIRCVSLGTQTPLAEIVAAVEAHGADAVALSFSAAFPARQVLPLVNQLRVTLPRSVGLWVGGSGIDRGVARRLEKSRAEAGREPGVGQDDVAVCHSLKDALEFAEQASRALP